MAKPTLFGRYHLTLHFLGDVGLAPEQRLRNALRQVAVPRLELELRIPEVWHNQVAVLQPSEHEGLRALRHRFAPALSAAGLQSEPQLKYKPHVTLARKAAQAVPPQATSPIPWCVDEFLLVWSVLPPEARPARYEVIERFGAIPGPARNPGNAA